MAKTGLVKKGNLEFQLVLWASSSHILLTQGYFLLILNDFVIEWLAWNFAHWAGKLKKQLLGQQENLLVPDYRIGPFFPEPRETQQNRVAACFPSCDNHKMAWAGNHKSNPIQSFFGGGGRGGGSCGRRIWVRNVKTLPGVVDRLEIEIGNKLI